MQSYIASSMLGITFVHSCDLMLSGLSVIIPISYDVLEI